MLLFRPARYRKGLTPAECGRWATGAPVATFSWSAVGIEVQQRTTKQHQADAGIAGRHVRMSPEERGSPTLELVLVEEMR